MKRIEIIGIDATAFALIFKNTALPENGDEVELQEGVKIVNLTSPAPNLMDTGIFMFMLETAVDLTATILTGLVTNYLQDILKDKINKKIAYKETPTKIQIVVEDEAE